jgi:NAD(P)-dependent dehydrogenase (short-subunit alcohol dehydrogenase family)
MSSKPELAGQTAVVIGGSSGIGLETARRARAEGASVILTARDPDRLHRVGLELGASIAAFDTTDFVTPAQRRRQHRSAGIVRAQWHRGTLEGVGLPEHLGVGRGVRRPGPLVVPDWSLSQL